ncbi:MAG: class I SAM-dependent methyltransferase [Magnetococcus sp. YQC-9]
MSRVRSALMVWLTRLPGAWQESLCRWLAKGMATDALRDLLFRVAEARVERLSADDGLRFLFRLDDRLYKLQGRGAVRLGGGVHLKHRLMGYHDFFVGRVTSGERVLDVGCGNGALTRDMAARAGCRVVGVELNPQNVAEAKRRHPHPQVEYRHGDATRIDGDLGVFDVVALSNVLEHLPVRVAFLKRLVAQSGARRLLIRVPLFERDWRVPLKRELGVEWRLDTTHETEYTLESFQEEMHASGLTITHLEVRWGEIWAEVRPVGDRAEVKA